MIDDCSTDNTKEILDSYGDKSGFRYFRNNRNLGAAGSRNLGVREAKGEYIAFLDADDWWAEGKLREQLELLRQTGSVLCSTGRELMNPDGTSAGKYIPVKAAVTYRDLLAHNSINCSSVLVKREAVLRFPMEHDDSHEDYLTWLKILKHYGPAAGINKPLSQIPSHGKQQVEKQGEIGGHGHTGLYRYMGYNILQSAVFFVSYALHGLWKYK